MQLYVQDARQAKSWKDLDIDELCGLKAKMHLLSEFSVMPRGPADERDSLHVEESFFACQEGLFRLGVGPIPFIRRPGVAVLVSPSMRVDCSEKVIGCIVPHDQRNGCRCPSERRCYFCVENPFYEVCFSPYNGAGTPYRFFAEYLVEPGVVLRPGSELLLQADAPGLVEVFPRSQHGPAQRSAPRTQCGPRAGHRGRPDDILLLSDSQVASSQASQAPDDGSTGGDHLVCWLQVPSSISPRDGLLAVSIRCRYGPDTSQSHTVLVAPDCLHKAMDRTETDMARQYVYGPPRGAGVHA